MQILIEPIPLGYRASALTLADAVTTGKTKDEALALMKALLTKRFTKGVEIVELEIAADKDNQSNEENNPYLKIAGVFKDDPTFDDWIQEIQNAREKEETTS
jgi:predicted RNase H-like HicB family nuclease